MTHDHAPTGSSQPLIWAMAAILAVYGLSLLAGWPQKGTEMVVHGALHEEHGEKGGASAGQDTPHGPEVHEEHPAAPEGATPATAAVPRHPPLWMVLPFAGLLLAIAVLPLVPQTEHWWESNLHRFAVAAGLGAITLLYYLFMHEIPVAAHWPAHDVVAPRADGLNYRTTWTVLANAILGEYIPFIMLLFSLYTISGGIWIEGDLPAHPLTNSLFLLAGGLLASFIGTTGAAMLLIRPLLETNSERRYVKHTVVFFVFVVCNCGGCLLPIGDPPLFLGYLRGVPFLWTFNLWPEWLFVNGLLIAVYYLWDHFVAYPKESPRDIARDETRVRGLRFSGVWPNAPLLLGVVLTVALLDPSKPVPGTDWHPYLYLREIVQLILVLASLTLGSLAVRRANNFNYHAILEVAALFFGIFICMQAPLEILHVRGPELGLKTPMAFFWATGSLSAALDNAPTYVVFFETAKTLEATPAVAGVGSALLVAISLGSVFMGAMTYIGNGPNFMVKAIAEKSGVPMPSFFGYMLYSCGVLLPILAATALIFLH